MLFRSINKGKRGATMPVRSAFGEDTTTEESESDASTTSAGTSDVSSTTSSGTSSESSDSEAEWQQVRGTRSKERAIRRQELRRQRGPAADAMSSLTDVAGFRASAHNENEQECLARRANAKADAAALGASDSCFAVRHAGARETPLEAEARWQREHDDALFARAARRKDHKIRRAIQEQGLPLAAAVAAAGGAAVPVPVLAEIARPYQATPLRLEGASKESRAKEVRRAERAARRAEKDERRRTRELGRDINAQPHYTGLFEPGHEQHIWGERDYAHQQQQQQQQQPQYQRQQQRGLQREREEEFPPHGHASGSEAEAGPCWDGLFVPGHEQHLWGERDPDAPVFYPPHQHYAQQMQRGQGQQQQRAMQYQQQQRPMQQQQQQHYQQQQPQQQQRSMQQQQQQPQQPRGQQQQGLQQQQQLQRGNIQRDGHIAGCPRSTHTSSAGTTAARSGSVRSGSDEGGYDPHTRAVSEDEWSGTDMTLPDKPMPTYQGLFDDVR